MSSSVYRQRRARLAQQLTSGIAVLPTAPERPRNRDNYFPYRFDSTFYYLTGFEEPEAVLVVLGGKEPKSILFCREKDGEREIWDGFRYGPKAAQRKFGFDLALPIGLLDQKMLEFVCGSKKLFTFLGEDAGWDTRVMGWFNSIRGRSRSGVKGPGMLCDVRQISDEMRLFKDKTEMDLMKKAADISAAAHCRAMACTRPGRMEFEIGAEISNEFARQGSPSVAYNSIVASGKNACVLHYVTNQSRLEPDDLLLIDAGCEYGGYAADITRTFPVDGQFKGAGKALYEIVLQAQLKAIEAVRPGQTFNDPHEAAVQVLTQGLVDLGLLKGHVEDLIETGEYQRFYMHRTSHWLGLDVHDVGEYKEENEWRTLLPDMVLTVEPGLYIRPAKDVPETFWNIGIRIEDDVRVTRTGHEVLTDKVPKSVGGIETLMANHD